ncbi:MAG: penicillin-binding transpeptidase domain-containing protein, partial [Acidobacteria bacterium]|nr:penicillin-binding transpeptidase domain-containing protein [Acidobacteriota bacterium]
MRILVLILTLALLQSVMFGVTRRRTHHKRTRSAVMKKRPAAKAKAAHSAAKKRSRRVHRVHMAGGPWKSPTFAPLSDLDLIDGEDLTVRRAAAEALSSFNGTVVVTDVSTGRILSIVNQKLAFQGGFQPCSTVKLVTALAALSEGVIDRGTYFRLSRRTRWDLTTALARSNNGFFATLGVKLGFEKVRHYAKLFGLGEKAGLNIAQEQPGVLPDLPPKNGGVGMMTSFGEGISLTPLELAALVGAIGNGGTLYYLQYPKTQQEGQLLQPKVKRHLAIASFVDDVKPGMRGAVEFGTARRASADQNEAILGKTGTCTDYRASSHMGWFGSFNDSGSKKLAVVVMLTGSRGVSGPVAAGIAGDVYRRLSQEGYFGSLKTPLALV